MDDQLRGISDKLKCISDSLDEMRREHTRDKYENLSYILWGFTLAMIGLSVTNPHPANVVISIVFFIMGWMLWFLARKVKTRQDAGNQMAIGIKRRLVQSARGFEWAFGTVLLTAISVILSLRYLNGFGRALLLVGLGMFLAATVTVRLVEAGWFQRRGEDSEKTVDAVQKPDLAKR